LITPAPLLGHEQPPEEIVPPLHVFEDTVAPSGLAVYRGDAFPGWQDNLLVGGLVAEGVIRLAVGHDGRVVDEEKIQLDHRIRDVQIAADGSIWVVTKHSDGEVLRLTASR